MDYLNMIVDGKPLLDDGSDGGEDFALNHVQPSSPDGLIEFVDSIPVERYLEKVMGHKKLSRRRCVCCYEAISKTRGRKVATSQARKVNTRCNQCKTHYCESHFIERHLNSDFECSRKLGNNPDIANPEPPLLQIHDEKDYVHPILPNSSNPSSSRSNDEMDVSDLFGGTSESTGRSKLNPRKRPRTEEALKSYEPSLNPLFSLLQKKFNQYERECPLIAGKMESDLINIMFKYDLEAKALPMTESTDDQK